MWRARLLLAMLLASACASRPAADAQPQAPDAEQLRRENARLREEIARLRPELKLANMVLAAYRQRFGVVNFCGSPSVNGRILAVHEQELEISLGAEDGVRPGDVFALRRGADYVGMVTVTRVREETAYARVQELNRGKVFPPQAGDIAYAADTQ